VLEVTFTFQTVVDKQGLTRYCYVTTTGLEAPTLHVYPGNQLVIHFQNQLPPATAGGSMPGMQMPMSHPTDSQTTTGDCSGSGVMTAATTNLHFHGMNVPPTCGQDDVIHTMIQPGDTFTYDVQIPRDEPPGLYWYHPHPHGFSEGQVHGGAAGALIVEGIQNVNTSLAGLPERLFVLHDQLLPGLESYDANTPSWDISLNYVPVPYPHYPPAIVQTPPAEQELWRVLNASADTIFNVQYVVNGVLQPMKVVAIDGYPIGGEDGIPPTHTETSLLLPPGARAEFVATSPNLGDRAQIVTEHWDSGPDGASNPARPIENIVAQATPQPGLERLPSQLHAQKFTQLVNLGERPVARRALYFSEVFPDANNPNRPSTFFITVDGQTPTAYHPNEPPNIVVHQGTVEDWTVQNRAFEDHIFHIHQLHFRVRAVNGLPVNDPAMRDTIDLPSWSGKGPYPSVTLRMDFRNSSFVGTFVYHCHILAHEDHGMMGTVQIVQRAGTTTTLSASANDVNLNESVAFTTTVAPAVAGGPAPTGTVQFAEDGTNVGATVMVSGGKASMTVPLQTSGSHTITAFYSGDSTYSESASNAFAITVEDYSLSATAATIPQPGRSGNSVITITASENFKAVINFVCSLPNSMAEAACFVNPRLATGSGQVMLTVNTTPEHALVPLHIRIPPLGPVGGFVCGLLLLLAVSMLSVPRSKWRNLATLGLVLLAISWFAISCGGSNTISNLGTLPGTYNVVVTGTSGSGSTQIQHK
jgi:FtsP/CotA-like multicopper oxidase with cupredoxin domain